MRRTRCFMEKIPKILADRIGVQFSRYRDIRPPPFPIGSGDERRPAFFGTFDIDPTTEDIKT